MKPFDNIPDPALLGEAARLEREYPMQKIEAAQFESLFEQRLEAYEADREMLVQEQEDQDQIAARLREANKALSDARKGDSSTREREKALQELETGYLKYKEIVTNMDTARKFYNDLANHVSRFREACKAQVKQRKIEAGQLEADITNAAMSSLNLQETSASLQKQKMQENARAMPSQNQVQQPLMAPLPTRAPVAPPPPTGTVWSPDMGIKFGGPPTQVNRNVSLAQGRPNNVQWDQGRGGYFT
jgi:programmed cell death 6-interacting protein